MTWLTSSYPSNEAETWSLSNPYSQIPCDTTADANSPLARCLFRNENDTFTAMQSQILGSTLVIFGGVTSVSGEVVGLDRLPNLTAVNTTHFYAFNSTGWVESTSSIAPPPRWGHVACRRSFATMMVFGGASTLPPLMEMEALFVGANGTSEMGILNDTWMYSVLDDEWVGPLNLTSPSAAVACGTACEEDVSPPALGRCLAADTRVGTMWYVYGGMTESGDGTIDVLWALNVATISPNATSSSPSPGWQYYRLLSQPAVFYPGSGQTLDWNLVSQANLLFGDRCVAYLVRFFTSAIFCVVYFCSLAC